MARQDLVVCESPVHGFPLSLNVMDLAWYQPYSTLWSCVYYTYFDFTINTYLQCCNTPVLNTPLFRAQLRKEISLTSSRHHSQLTQFLSFPSSSPLPGPLSLPLKSPRLLMTTAYNTSPSGTIVKPPRTLLNNRAHVTQANIALPNLIILTSHGTYLVPHLTTHKGPLIF